MSENIDIIVSNVAKLPRDQFDLLLKKLSDAELDYLLRSMKFYRERYPYPMCTITNFN